MPILLTDTNSVMGLWEMGINGMFGGDYILMGLFLIGIIVATYLLTKSKAASFGVTLVMAVYLLSIFEPLFKPLFFIAIVVAVFMFVLGVKRKLSGG